MLPKLWKKVLLAVCIVACIYNVMSKLVNRNSLEINLKSVDDGTTVFELFKEKEDTIVEPEMQSDTTIEEPQIPSEEPVEAIVSQPTEEEKQKDRTKEFIVLY